MASYSELKAMGLSEGAIRAALDTESREALEASTHNVGRANTNNLNNLKSSIATYFSNIATAPEGTFTGEHSEDLVDMAKEYMQAVEQAGGISNINMSEQQINAVLSEIEEINSDYDTGGYLASDFSTIEAAAIPLQNSETDEQTYERVTQEEKESRNSDKPWSEEDNIVINESSGTKFVRLENGELEKYVDPGSDEYMESNIASSDEAFVANGGQSTESGIFAGLTDK